MRNKKIFVSECQKCSQDNETGIDEVVVAFQIMTCDPQPRQCLSNQHKAVHKNNLFKKRKVPALENDRPYTSDFLH